MTRKLSPQNKNLFGGEVAKDTVSTIEAMKNNPDNLPMVRELAQDAIDRRSGHDSELNKRYSDAGDND